MDFQDFLNWLKLRESIADDTQPYLKECFDYAYNQGMVVSNYLAPFQLKAYVYCLATHLIILTPNKENLALHQKYFPTDKNLTNSNLLSVIGSVSNSVSSVSNIAYSGLQNLSLKDAMLTSTPYGMEVASMNEAFNVSIVMV